MRLVRRLRHCQEPSGFFARPLEKAGDLGRPLSRLSFLNPIAFVVRGLRGSRPRPSVKSRRGRCGWYGGSAIARNRRAFLLVR